MYLIAALPWLLNPANWGVVLQVAAGLGFVIFVHELGHFLVAKACGVKCEKFFLGFDIYGLKIFSFQWGETEYGIGILPLGGYVKMLGQDDNPARYSEEARRSQLGAEGAKPQAAVVDSELARAEKAPPLTHGDLPSEPVSDPHVPYDPRSYMAQSVPKRMAIISAGVIMNVIFAFFMASLAYGIGVKETPCIVRNVVPGGAAWLAGLEPGDVVKRIGKIENPRFRDLQTGVTLGDLENGVEFEIFRPSTDKTFVATLHPDKSLGVPMIGVVGPWQAELADLTEVPPTFKWSPARQAEPKFKAGDKFVQINDVPSKSEVDVQQALVKFIDDKVKVTIQRKLPKGDTAAANANAETAQEVIEVGPTPLRDFGLIMTMEPVSAMRPESVAKANGMLIGDKILEIDGKPAGNPLTLPDRMRRAAIAGNTVDIKVSRILDSGKTEEPTLKLISPAIATSYDELLPTNPLSVPSLGIAFKVTNKVAGIVPGSPAEQAKISVGDEITSARMIMPPKVAGADEDIKDAIEPSKIEFGKDPAWPYFIWEALPFTDPAAKWELEVKTGDKTRKVELATVELKDDGGNVVHGPSRGFIFQPMSILRTAETFGQALQFGARETRDNLLLVYRFLQKITQKQISVKLLGGPVEIFRQAGRSAQQGFSDFLLFLTMLSANLAVINFLPIPVLDGGHMVFLLYELIRRKPASERVIVAFTYLGLIFILSLMLFVLSLDLGLISRR